MNIEKKLYQWDTEQKLTGCTGLYVDFPIGDEVYRVETADGTCIIPDELLQTSGGHKVYECMTNNTIRSFAFSVTPRPQPPDYVFTPTERLTFEGLVQKVDDAVADMIRRAESGEFDGHTPVKGTDYFTTEEIQQIQNEVSSGAIGEFKSAVNTETNKFNANATERVNAYNQNDSEKTTSYNANATAKLNTYNANANNRVAEFDSHTEQIQTDIGELKSDLFDLYALHYYEYYEKKPLLKETGVCIGTDGTKFNKTDFVICKYEVTEDSVLKLNLSKDNETGAVYQFMNSSTLSYISNSNVIGNTVTNGTNDFVRVPKGATYLMVSMASTNTTNKVYATKSILDTDDNMFCKEFANNTLSQLSKSSPEADYISDTNTTFGYKDIEHGYFVFGSTGYNVGIIDGLPLPLNVGNYKLSAKVCIPSGNDAVSKLYFGAYTFPDGSIPFKQLDLVNIENLDTWVTIEKIITIDETHTHVYIGGRGYGNFPIYMKNISFSPLTDKKTDKKWVVIGDSHTERNSFATKRYYDYIVEQEPNINVVVNGIGGTGFKNGEDSNTAYYQRVLNLPTDTDVVTLFTSNNDLALGVSIGTYTDITTDTICGCINKTIDNLYSVLPTVKLGIITNVPKSNYDPMSTTESEGEQLNNAVIELCKRRGIPYVDLFHSSGLRPWDSNFKALCYKHDENKGHFDEDGHAFLAPRIKSLLDSIII